MLEFKCRIFTADLSPTPLHDIEALTALRITSTRWKYLVERPAARPILANRKRSCFLTKQKSF